MAPLKLCVLSSEIMPFAKTGGLADAVGDRLPELGNYDDGDSSLKLCVLSSEIMPFAKTGGLADAVGGMVRELAQRDHDVRAFMPLYASVRRACGDLQTVPGLQEVGIIIGTRVYSFSVRTDRKSAV